MEAESGSERVLLTIPNAVTLIRIILIPVFVYLSWSRNRLISGAILLGFIGATDWIDGYLARRLNQVSTVGKIIDPSADRLLLIAAGIVTVHLQLIPDWLLLVVFMREVLVSLVVGTAALRFKVRFDVVRFGKAGTLLTMFGFPFFVAAGYSGPLHSLALAVGYLFMIPGAAVLYMALWSYSVRLFRLGFQHSR